MPPGGAAAWDENLLIPALLTVIDLWHEIDTIERRRGDVVLREQVARDFLAKYWGAVPGVTLRADPALRHVERALGPWLQALEGYRTRFIQHTRRQGGAHG